MAQAINDGLISSTINGADFSLPLQNTPAFTKTINDVYQNDFLFQEDKIYACLRHFSGISFHLASIDSLFLKGNDNRSSRDPHIVVLSMRMLKALNYLNSTVAVQGETALYKDFLTQLNSIENEIFINKSYNQTITTAFNRTRSAIEQDRGEQGAAQGREQEAAQGREQEAAQGREEDNALMYTDEINTLQTNVENTTEKYKQFDTYLKNFTQKDTYIVSKSNFPSIDEVVRLGKQCDKRRFLDPRLLETGFRGPTNVYQRLIKDILLEVEYENPTIALNWDDYEKELEHVVVSAFQTAYNILRTAYKSNPNAHFKNIPSLNYILKLGPSVPYCSEFIRLAAAVYGNTITNGRSLVNNTKVRKTLSDLSAAQSSVYRMIEQDIGHYSNKSYLQYI